MSFVTPEYLELYQEKPPAHRRLSAAARAAFLRLRDERNELAFRCERLEAALDAVGDGVWDVDLRTGRTHYSPGWARMLGYEQAEIGNTVEAALDLLHPEDREATGATFEEHVRDERDEEYLVECRMRHRSGRWVDVLSRGSVVRDHNGEAVRFIGTHVDVTRTKREQARAEEAAAAALAAVRERAAGRRRLAEALGVSAERVGAMLDTPREAGGGSGALESALEELLEEHRGRRAAGGSGGDSPAEA